MSMKGSGTGTDTWEFNTELTFIHKIIPVFLFFVHLLFFILRCHIFCFLSNQWYRNCLWGSLSFLEMSVATINHGQHNVFFNVFIYRDFYCVCEQWHMHLSCWGEISDDDVINTSQLLNAQESPFIYFRTLCMQLIFYVTRLATLFCLLLERALLPLLLQHKQLQTTSTSTSNHTFTKKIHLVHLQVWISRAEFIICLLPIPSPTWPSPKPTLLNIIITSTQAPTWLNKVREIPMIFFLGATSINK